MTVHLANLRACASGVALAVALTAVGCALEPRDGEACAIEHIGEAVEPLATAEEHGTPGHALGANERGNQSAGPSQLNEGQSLETLEVADPDPEPWHGGGKNDNDSGSSND